MRIQGGRFWNYFSFFLFFPFSQGTTFIPLSPKRMKIYNIHWMLKGENALLDGIWTKYRVSFGFFRRWVAQNMGIWVDGGVPLQPRKAISVWCTGGQVSMEVQRAQNTWFNSNVGLINNQGKKKKKHLQICPLLLYKL